MFKEMPPTVKRIAVNEDEIKRMLKEEHDCEVVEISYSEKHKDQAFVSIFLDKEYSLENLWEAKYKLMCRPNVIYAELTQYPTDTGIASMFKITLDGRLYDKYEEGYCE